MCCGTGESLADGRRSATTSDCHVYRRQFGDGIRRQTSGNAGLCTLARRFRWVLFVWFAVGVMQCGVKFVKRGETDRTDVFALLLQRSHC